MLCFALILATVTTNMAEGSPLSHEPPNLLRKVTFPYCVTQFMAQCTFIPVSWIIWYEYLLVTKKHKLCDISERQLLNQ